MSIGGGGASKKRFIQTRADKNFSLTSTATDADQSIGTSAPTDNKKYVVQAIVIEVTYTAISTTAAHFGTVTVRWGATSILGPIQCSNPSSGAAFGFVVPVEAIFKGDGSTAINAICTPAAVTSMAWKVSILGYEEALTV